MSESNPPYTSRRSIGANTRYVSTLGAMITLIAGVAIATWKVRDYAEDQRAESRAIRGDMRDMRDDIKSLRADLSAYARESWKFDEQNSFAGHLRWLNRDLTLAVPEPRDFRR